MMANKLNSFWGGLVAIVLTTSSLNAQQTVNHHVPFNSTGQNMWGPSWSPFTIDQEITIFEQGWDVSYNTGNAMIFSIAGQSFGAGLQGSFSGLIGSKISLTGFTTGTLDVDYPVDVTLDMPTDLTYDQGDNVVIKTDYEVDPTAELKTFYPSVGEAKWDLYMQLGASASATLCAFGCTSFPIIPSFNTGLVNINLVTANASGLWFLGPADPTGPDGPGINGFPYSKPPISSTSDPYIPWQCYVPFFPFDLPDVGFGISGEITIPYVETTSGIGFKDLGACGDSTYFHLNLEIFDLIGEFNIPYVSAVAANLSGSQSFGPAEVNWNFFSASFDANLTNKQCFDFNPKVYGTFQFPVAVDYQIIDTVLGTTSAWAQSSIINVEIGKHLRYKFPCYFESLNITPTYSIVGQMHNHTWDSISFDFWMSAFEFGFDIPSITVITEIHVPEICIPIPYPCPYWSNPFKWCTEWVCTPAFTIPAIGFPGLHYTLGPLWDTSIPLGSIEYDWFDETWTLEGFSTYTMPPFAMNARKISASATHTDVSCNGGNDGTVDVTLTNAETPASFVWTNGASTEDLSNVVASPYEVSITDANGCQIFTGATVLEPSQALSVSLTSTDKNCNGGVNDGTITSLVTGGTVPYSYNWTNGATTPSVSGLNVGLYSLTVTDANGCTAVASSTINQPDLFGQTGAISNVKCFSESTGAVAVDVFGGELPYSYSWSNGQLFEDITGLNAGNYTLTITDGNGCVSSQLYTVNQPAAALSLTSTTVNVACNGNATGSINVTTTGGTPGYFYQWSNGSNIVMPNITEDLSGIIAGTYTIKTTDANGCQAQLSQTITQPLAPVSSVPTLTHINCFGGTTGAIVSGITGGTAPYTYSWSNGATTANIVNVSAGTYTLNVLDNNGCNYSFTYTLTQPTNPLNTVLTGTNVLCFGNSTGEVTSAVSGGTAPYSYLWNNGSTNSSITGVLAGNYNLVVTDSKGCTTNSSITITQPATPLTTSTVVTNVACYGNSTGAIDLTPAGGTAPYTYYWSNSQSLVLSTIAQDLTNQPANGYTALVTDANGCQSSITSTITQPIAPLGISGIVNDANCYGLHDGAFDISVSGGTLNYSYAWSNSASSQDLSSIIAGNYTVTVTDNNGCTLTSNFTVDQPQEALSITTYTESVLCNGGTTGSAQSDVIGGTLPYTYAWSNGATTPDIDQVAAGVYSLTVTDAQGCVAFTGAVVGQPAQALTVVPTVIDPSCFGYSDGSIELAISGGVQPYYMNWGNQNEIMLNNPSELLDSLTTNDYFVRIKDKNGCMVEMTITVNQPTLLTSTYIVSDALCYGENTGSIDVTVNGATPPYLYSWNNGQTTEDLVNIPSGVYDYVITDNQGCILRQQVVVNQPNQINITSQIVEVSCIDQSDAAIYVNPYGGTMPYTFVSTNGTTLQNAEELAPGNYSIIITDDHSCAATFDFTIQMSDEACMDIPNTITPNGDNYNDTWVLDNLELYPNAHVMIFNKWGNMIYSSTGAYTPWDGTYNGEPLPSQVYYYIIELKNSLDDKYTGTITIIR